MLPTSGNLKLKDSTDGIATGYEPAEQCPSGKTFCTFFAAL
jgi:hypothetical protein